MYGENGTDCTVVFMFLYQISFSKLPTSVSNKLHLLPWFLFKAAFSDVFLFKLTFHIPVRRAFSEQ